MSERPCILSCLIILLEIVRHVATLGVLPSYILLCSSMAFLESNIYKPGASSLSRSVVYAVCAIPRLVVVVVMVPLGLLGVAAGMEIAVHYFDIGWPPAIAAALGAGLTLHAIVFLRQWLPQKYRLRFESFPKASLDALLDVFAMAAALLVAGSLYRIPVVCSNIAAKCASGDARKLILQNAGLVFVDLLCLPALVVLLVSPWRWLHAKERLLKLIATPLSVSLEQRSQLCLCAVDAVIDVPCILLGFLTILNPFRFVLVVKESLACKTLGECRYCAILGFGSLIADAACLFVLFLLALAPWRFVWALQDARGKDWRFTLCRHLGLAGVDILAIISFVIVAPSHRSWLCNSSALQKKWRGTPEMQLEVVKVAGNLLLDILLCTIPLCILLIVPWRLIWAVEDARDKDGRYAVARHFCLAGIDILAILSMPFITLSHRSWLRTSPITPTSKWRDCPDVQCKALQTAAELFLDVIVCTVPLICVLGSIYRLPVLIDGIRTGKCRNRCFICSQGGHVVIEIPLMVLGCCLVVMPWRLVTLIRRIVDQESTAKRYCVVLEETGLALCDLATFVALLLLCSTCYRLPIAISRLARGNGRRAVFWQLGVMLLEMPLIILSVLLLFFPWRLVWLFKDICTTSNVTFKRLAVFHHIRFGIADVLAMFALLLLMLFAPHRLFAPVFRNRLRRSAHHIRKSANRTFSYARPEPRVPEEGSVITAYHGTSAENASKIESSGFRPSTHGMLGPGVYVSRDPSKAESYGSVILVLKVTIAKLVTIEYQKHPSQQDWSAKGYDGAWVPAGCGMVQSNREEGCIADPNKIQVKGRFVRSHHPHSLCVGEALSGVIDLVVCSWAVLLVLVSVYRFPTLVQEVLNGRKNMSNWELRCCCWKHALSVICEVLACLLSLLVIILSPARFVTLLWALRIQKYNAAHLLFMTLCSLICAGLVDPLCYLAGALLITTVYRLPALRGFSFSLYFAWRPANDGLSIPSLNVQCIVLWEVLNIMVDVLFLPLGLLSISSWRSCFFFRSFFYSNEEIRLGREAVRRPNKESTTSTENKNGSSEERFETPHVIDSHDPENLSGASSSSIPSDCHVEKPCTHPAAKTTSLVKSNLELQVISTPHAIEDLVERGEVSASAEQMDATVGEGRCSDPTLSVASPKMDIPTTMESPKTDKPTIMEEDHNTAHLAQLGKDTNEALVHSKDCWDDTINCLRWASMHSFLLVLNDVIIMVCLLLCLVFISRIPSLYKRTLASLKRFRANTVVKPEGENECVEGDFDRAIAHLRTCDGNVDHLSLSFFQLVSMEEALRSIVNLPLLLLAPLAIFVAPQTILETYVRKRFAFCSNVGKESDAPPSSTQDSTLPTTSDEAKLSFPHCFFALPLPCLLRLFSYSPGDALQDLMLQTFTTLAMLCLLILHEVSSLVGFLVVVPSTLGFLFWKESFRKCKLGRFIRNICQALQAATFPCVLGALIVASFAPILLWWQPDQGWMNFDPPISIRRPSQAESPPWYLWIAQFHLVLVFVAVCELLVRARKVGYHPLRGLAGVVWEIVGLITGHARLWRLVDALMGCYISCCYHHRRTCYCLGEIGLALCVLSFFTWPFLLPFNLIHEDEALGRRIMWWIGAALLSCVLLFHAIRLTRRFWKPSGSESTEEKV